MDSVCCRTKLSKLLRDDWSKNDDETWGESDLGPCKTTLYKVGFVLQLNGGSNDKSLIAHFDMHIMYLRFAMAYVSLF